MTPMALLFVLFQLSFDVASIKPAKPITPEVVRTGSYHFGITLSGTNLDIGYASPGDLIALALSVKPDQISGPPWLNDPRFDIRARLPEGATREQVPAMMEALLKDRFHLAYHRSEKEQTVLTLLVDKDGPKMRSVESTGFPTPQLSPGSEVGQLHVEVNMTMPAFVAMLSQFLHRAVVDETGLTGTYHAGFQISTDPTDEGNVVKQSLKDLGLHLESQKRLLPFITIDHLEKTPTDN